MSKLQPLLKEIIQSSLGRHGPMGGIRFDTPDEKFDAQPALVLLPRSIVAPVELLLAICTTGLSDTNKDIVVGYLADAICERLEHFVSQVKKFGVALLVCFVYLVRILLQTTFRFAGALKFEECIRAVNSALSKASSTSLRGKFSRLREILLILTSDVSSLAAGGSGSGVALDAGTTLSNNEVMAYLSLRADYHEQ
jgi:hypothetical protein